MQFDDLSDPMIPVRVYFNTEQKDLQISRKTTLDELQRLLEGVYQTWVMVYYLDDSSQKVQIGTSLPQANSSW